MCCRDHEVRQSPPLNFRRTLEHLMDIRGQPCFQARCSRSTCHSWTIRQIAVRVQLGRYEDALRSRGLGSRRNTKLCAHGVERHGGVGGNGNDYIDEADRRFENLLLWTDRNHDGRSSSNELLHLNDRGIFAIALHPDESDVIDEHGNRLAYVSPAYAWRRFRIQRIRTTDIFFWYRELAPQR